MNGITYNPRYEVVASWALEFMPTNCSVVFCQPIGDEVHIIGSRSYMFTQLAEAVADVRTAWPWKASQHLIPWTKESDWLELFKDLGIRTATQVVTRELAIQVTITQALLGRCWIDTESRNFEPDGNNDILIDSLNGYSVREVVEDQFTAKPLEWQYQAYMVRALERYAVWDRKRKTWSRKPNYAEHDRAVI